MDATAVVVAIITFAMNTAADIRRDAIYQQLYNRWQNTMQKCKDNNILHNTNELYFFTYEEENYLFFNSFIAYDGNGSGL